MIWTIPLPTSDEPFVTQSVSLDGRSYVFTIDWNSRTDRWTFGIATEDGDAILSGALLCIAIDLLRTIPSTLDYVPPGALYVAGFNDPTLDTISSATLFYVPA